MLPSAAKPEILAEKRGQTMKKKAKTPVWVWFAAAIGAAMVVSFAFEAWRIHRFYERQMETVDDLTKGF